MILDISGYQAVSILAFTISLFVDIRKETRLSLFTSFLAFTVLFEIILANSLATAYMNNSLAYNINALGSVLFYFLIFKKEATKKFALVFLIWFILSIFWVLKNGIASNFEMTPYTVGMSLVLIVISIHFYNAMFVKRQLNFLKDYRLSLGLGIVLFYLCMFPLLLFFKILMIDNANYKNYTIFFDISNFILTIGYLMAAITRWRVN